MYSWILQTFLHFLFLFSNTFGKISLPLCSEISDELVTKEKEICKLTSKYPNFPLVLQPSLNIREVLELDEIEKSITFSIFSHFSWNDTAVIAKGQNSFENQ